MQNVKDCHSNFKGVSYWVSSHPLLTLNYTIMTDKEKSTVLSIVNDAKAGKQLAFTKLYNKYYGLIRYVVYDILRNNDATDDVVSTAFTKAFLKIDTFVDNISFETWLKTIAINCSIDYIRQMKSENNNMYVDDDDCYIQLDSTDSSPEDKLIQQENIDKINNAYETLRPFYRNLIDMKVNKGLSNEQIGNEMGLSSVQVRDHLYDARVRLKKLINQS